jgi:hypothetical protein
MIWMQLFKAELRVSLEYEVVIEAPNAEAAVALASTGFHELLLKIIISTQTIDFHTFIENCEFELLSMAEVRP